MAAPDTDDGWFRFALELDSAIGFARLGEAAGVLLRYGLHQVYGAGERPKVMVLRQTELAERTGQDRNWAFKGIGELLRKRILVEATGRHEYRLQKDYERWVGKGGKPLLSRAQVRDCQAAPGYARQFNLGPRQGAGPAVVREAAAPPVPPPLPARDHFHAPTFDFMAAEPGPLPAPTPTSVAAEPPAPGEPGPRILPMVAPAPAPRPAPTAGGAPFDPNFVPLAATGYHSADEHARHRARTEAVERWAGPIFWDRPDVLSCFRDRPIGVPDAPYLVGLATLRDQPRAKWCRSYCLAIVRRLEGAGVDPAELAAAEALVRAAGPGGAPPAAGAAPAASTYADRLNATRARLAGAAPTTPLGPTGTGP